MSGSVDISSIVVSCKVVIPISSASGAAVVSVSSTFACGMTRCLLPLLSLKERPDCTPCPRVGFLAVSRILRGLPGVSLAPGVTAPGVTALVSRLLDHDLVPGRRSLKEEPGVTVCPCRGVTFLLRWGVPFRLRFVLPIVDNGGGLLEGGGLDLLLREAMVVSVLQWGKESPF